MKKSNIKVVEIENGVLTVIYTSGARRYYDIENECNVPESVMNFMIENIDTVIYTESRTGHTCTTYCADNTFNKALESTRVYAQVSFGGEFIKVGAILKSFLTRDDVNVVFCEHSESYKVFYNGKRHHVYTNSLLYKSIKALNLIVEHVD